LIFGYATPAHAVYGKIQVGVALDVLLDLHRARAEERIASQLSKVIRNVGDADFPLVARLVASMNEAPALVNEAARIRLAEFLRTGPLAEIEKTVSGLARHPELATAAATRIATLDSTQLAAVIAAGARLDAIKERALALLGEARNYDRVNLIFLRMVMPLLGSLGRADIERVIRMPGETGADLIGANGYGPFISEVRAGTLIPAAELDALLRANRADYLVPAPEEPEA
jgi:hypothetical protein